MRSPVHLLCALLRPLALLLATAGLLACGASAGIEPGIYRATLALAGGELPFTLQLAREGEQWSAVLINGTGRVPVDDVKIDGRKLEMTLPGYPHRLQARWRRSGLEGTFELDRPGASPVEIAFRAVPGAPWRFFEQPSTDNADVSGRWRVTFTDAQGRQTAAVGEFTQKFHVVSGTFLTSVGDHGELAGEMHGEDLYLSTFDGGRAYLFKARVQDDGSLRGTWWTGAGGQQEFTAVRDHAAELQDPDRVVQIRDETWHLGFTFPDETGKAVSLADARFRGKAIVVSLLGSWCPNSHDAVAYLTPLYREERARGVEFIALMFEHSADFKPAANAVKRLRAAYGVEFPTLIAGVSDKAKAAEQLPLLSGVHAYPTFLFIDRRGRVRRIYSGFAGPATGAHFEAMSESFAATLAALSDT